MSPIYTLTPVTLGRLAKINYRHGEADHYLVERFGPDEARLFLATVPAYQRAVRPSTATRYERAMGRGEWSGMPSIFVVSRSGRLIDGQHRCEAIVKSGVTLPVHIIVPDDEHAYRHIDQGVARSVADVIRYSKATGIVPEALKTLPKEAVTAAAMLHTRFDPKRKSEMTAQEQLDVAIATPHIERLMKVTGLRSNPAPMVAAVLACVQADSEAVAFFSSAFESRVPPEGRPQAAAMLRDWILDAKKAVGARAKRRSPREYFYIGVRAWNAYASGEDLKLLKYSSRYKSPRPIKKVDVKKTDAKKKGDDK